MDDDDEFSTATTTTKKKSYFVGEFWMLYFFFRGSEPALTHIYIYVRTSTWEGASTVEYKMQTFFSLHNFFHVFCCCLIFEFRGVQIREEKHTKKRSKERFVEPSQKFLCELWWLSKKTNRKKEIIQASLSILCVLVLMLSEPSHN